MTLPESKKKNNTVVFQSSKKGEGGAKGEGLRLSQKGKIRPAAFKGGDVSDREK